MKNFIRKIWDAIVNMFCRVPYDKLLHFIGGLVLSLIAYFIFDIKLCCIPAIAAGLLKEFFDLWTTKNFDWMDFVATSLGGILVQIIILIGFVS